MDVTIAVVLAFLLQLSLIQIDRNLPLFRFEVAGFAVINVLGLRKTGT